MLASAFSSRCSAWSEKELDNILIELFLLEFFGVFEQIKSLTFAKVQKYVIPGKKEKGMQI